jgi:hypothetical protein
MGTGSLFSANSSARSTLSLEKMRVTADGLKSSSDLIWGRSWVSAKNAPAMAPQTAPPIRTRDMVIFFESNLGWGNEPFLNLKYHFSPVSINIKK